MKRIKLSILLFLIFICLFTLNAYALSDNYIDKASKILEIETQEDKINIYFFESEKCIHCKDEKQILEKFKEKYKDYVNIYDFEVFNNKTNADYLTQIRKEFNLEESISTPFTVIGDTYYTGFSKTIENQVENKIKEYAEISEYSKEIEIPFLGNVNKKEVSLPIVAIILGFIDGFNPCATWILLFLINMLFCLKDRKKSWILGLTFLFISGLVYFLSMLGVNLLLNATTIGWFKIIVAIFIIIAGIFNLVKYFKTRKENVGCTIIDNKKRKKIINKMNKIKDNKNFLLSLIGIVFLATFVNILELTCSLGFPMIFTELLSINNVIGSTRIIYILIYIFFYMLDDIIIFTISMITLKALGITNKYNKVCTLLSAMIMIAIGLLLMFKPDWLMLNF